MEEYSYLILTYYSEYRSSRQLTHMPYIPRDMAPGDDIGQTSRSDLRDAAGRGIYGMCISWGHMRAHMPYIPQTSRSDLRDAAGRSELGTNLLQPLSVVLPVNRPAAVLDTARPLARRLDRTVRLVVVRRRDALPVEATARLARRFDRRDEVLLPRNVLPDARDEATTERFKDDPLRYGLPSPFRRLWGCKSVNKQKNR